MPKRVTIVEVGPRDGLQNDPRIFTPAARATFVEDLATAGARVIEVASFVSPAAVPQMADSDEVMRLLTRREDRGEESLLGPLMEVIPGANLTAPFHLVQ